MKNPVYHGYCPWNERKCPVGFPGDVYFTGQKQELSAVKPRWKEKI